MSIPMALPADQPLVAAESTIRIADVALVQGPGGVIGHGALGEVRRATWRGTTVALKDLFMLRTDAAALAQMGGALDPEHRAAVRAKFARECEFMRSARHPNLLQFVGVVVDGEGQPVYLATEYVEGGTLHAEIHADAPMRFRRIIDALLDVTRGVLYLHSQGVIHRDLKPKNLLVMGGSGVVKVADLGEAKQLAHTTLARTSGSFGVGTPVYMAPEMRMGEEHRTVLVDIFSLGVIIIEMDSGRQPNPGPEMRRRGRQFMGVPEAERRAADLAAMRHPRLRELAVACIDDAEERRPTAARVLELLQGMAASDEYRRETRVRERERGSERDRQRQRERDRSDAARREAAVPAAATDPSPRTLAAMMDALHHDGPPARGEETMRRNRRRSPSPEIREMDLAELRAHLEQTCDGNDSGRQRPTAGDRVRILRGNKGAGSICVIEKDDHDSQPYKLTKRGKRWYRENEVQKVGRDVSIRISSDSDSDDGNYRRHGSSDDDDCVNVIRNARAAVAERQNSSSGNDDDCCDDDCRNDECTGPAGLCALVLLTMLIGSAVNGVNDDSGSCCNVWGVFDIILGIMVVSLSIIGRFFE
jgi:serine/threonine protein kinase